jgi:hypothetical protein
MKEWWFYATVMSLPWWATILWVVYLIYFIYRACKIWEWTNDYGIVKGYRYVFLGYKGKVLRLYHLLIMIFDIPPAILGLFFPVIKKVFSFKIYEFKDNKKEDKDNA